MASSNFSSSSFGELVLVVGDIHIPERASCIPKQLKRMLVPNKMQHILCTGNLGGSFVDGNTIEQNEIYNELVTLVPTSKSIHIVTGDWDNFTNTSSNTIPDINQGQQQTQTLPESVVIQIGSFTIGMIHGHQLIPYNNTTSTSTNNSTTTDSNTDTTGTTTGAAAATETETGTEAVSVEENKATSTDNETAIDATETSTTPTTVQPTTVQPETTSTSTSTSTNDCIDQIRRKLKTGILPNDGTIDIMITGHTHKSSVTVRSNYYHINPGSITGSYTSSSNDNEDTTNIVPSFILLAIQNDVATCYMYELINDEVIVSKTEFTKQHTISSS